MKKSLQRWLLKLLLMINKIHYIHNSLFDLILALFISFEFWSFVTLIGHFRCKIQLFLPLVGVQSRCLLFRILQGVFKAIKEHVMIIFECIMH